MSLISRPALDNLGQLLSTEVTRRPRKTAVVDGTISITYEQLDLQAKALAHRLFQLPFQSEELVLLLVPPGIDHIICQVAIVYAGGTCLPLDPKASDDDIQARADFTRAQILITSPFHTSREINVPHRLTFGYEGHLVHRADEPASHYPVPVSSDYRSHILFTSGTTGIPKCVQVHGRAIVRLRLGTYGADDRVAHVNNVCFDGSLFEIWIPLVNGATIIVVERDIILDPPQFARLLAEQAITGVMLTASLLAIVAASCPDAFRGCKTVVNVGETPNIPAVRNILKTAPPERLLNVYGPTEAGIFATSHEITLDDAIKGDIPLGEPVAETTVVLADKSLSPIHGEGTGELLLGGTGLSRGYFLNPTQTAEAFIEVPCDSRDSKVVRLYRTGDTVDRNAIGQLFWRGRQNNEIKYHGYRVNLDLIEAELSKSELVSLAAAFKLDKLSGDGASLVACVVPKEFDSEIREKCQREAILRLPAYMVPQIICLDRLSMSPNGKIDRTQLAAHVLNRRQQAVATVNSIGLSDTEDRLRKIWHDCLGAFSLDDIGPHSDFFLFGAASLHVTAAVSKIRQEFNMSLPVQKLYENPTLSGLASEIDKKLGGNQNLDHGVGDWKLLSDSRLADDLEISSRAIVDWTAKGEGKVVLTGVTGFVGAYLLKALTMLPMVQAVRCLVRSGSPERGRQRILDNLSKYRILADMQPHSLAKIVPVCGDLTHPTLGLDNASYKDLAEWSSVIFHLGAHVDYVQPYSVHRPANVLGTLHILKLAVSCRLKPVHYASTSASFGPASLAGKKFISEDEDLMPYIDTMPFETGYGQSKWVVELMMKSAMGKGLPATIHRLGFVLCDSTTGVGNPDDFVSRFFCEVFALRKYPILPANRKEVTTVDYVVSTMLLISSSPSNHGRAYHLLPDFQDTEDMSLAKFHDSLQILSGQFFTCLPFDEWVARVVEANDKIETRMKPLIPTLDEKVLVNKTRWEVYENMARFRTNNVKDALARARQPTSLNNSGVTDDILKRYLVFLGMPVTNVDGIFNTDKNRDAFTSVPGQRSTGHEPSSITACVKA